VKVKIFTCFHEGEGREVKVCNSSLGCVQSCPWLRIGVDFKRNSIPDSRSRAESSRSGENKHVYIKGDGSIGKFCHRSGFIGRDEVDTTRPIYQHR